MPPIPKDLSDQEVREISAFYPSHNVRRFRRPIRLGPVRQPITARSINGHHTDHPGGTRPGPRLICAAVGATVVLLSGCSEPQQRTEQNSSFDEPRTLNGDAAKGRGLIAAIGCGTCHTIPGVPGAIGIVGPPLNTFARRTYIAGAIPNEPTVLVAWVRDAPSLVRQTAMPQLPISHQEAVDIAAYLYTLRK